VSLLASVMVTATGAGAPKLTANVAVPPNPTVALVGNTIVPGAWTVTLEVAAGMFGRLLALIVADPAATPVTGTVTLLVPPVNWTVAGTVAAAVLLELTLTVTPAAGAFADRVSVRFCVVFIGTVRVCCVKLTVAFTCTGALDDT
jgi:hypothetical protein